MGLGLIGAHGAYFPQNRVRIRRRWAQVGALGRILAVAGYYEHLISKDRFLKHTLLK